MKRRMKKRRRGKEENRSGILFSQAVQFKFKALQEVQSLSTWRKIRSQTYLGKRRKVKRKNARSKKVSLKLKIQKCSKIRLRNKKVSLTCPISSRIKIFMICCRKLKSLKFRKLEEPEIQEVEEPELKEVEKPEIHDVEEPEIKEVEKPEIKEVEKPEVCKSWRSLWK